VGASRKDGWRGSITDAKGTVIKSYEWKGNLPDGLAWDVALDGTGYFYSENLSCPCCSVSKHKDGSGKEDCENQGVKRWLSKWGGRVKDISVTLLGDDLSANR
jgi:hypothetical protein